jgi:Immunoglobulin I-set domain
MRSFRWYSVVLSALLQFLPMARVVSTQLLPGASPILAILRFISGATAVAGSFHAVSGASISLVNPGGGQVRATNGVSSPFRIELTYDQGGEILKPQAYDAVNLPPGFNQPAKFGAIWRITGTPSKTGVFSNVKVTGYKDADKQGDNATVTLTITVVDGPPVIVTPPAGFTGTAGTAAQLQVTATGGNLTYQWLKEDLELTGKTEATLSFSPLSLADAGTYRVRVRNTGGLALSDPAVVWVIPGTQPPVFILSPASIAVHEGEAFVLTSAATGEGPLTFSWSKGNEALPNADGSNLPFAAAVPGDAGSYTVSATGAGGTTTPPPAVVTVVSPLQVGVPQPDAGILRLPFNGIPGRTYDLEFAASLTQAAWTPAGEMVATGAGADAFSVTESSGSAAWYRIRAR